MYYEEKEKIIPAIAQKTYTLKSNALQCKTRLICFQRILLNFSKSGQRFYPKEKTSWKSSISWNLLGKNEVPSRKFAFISIILVIKNKQNTESLKSQLNYIKNIR